ncbi:sensor histidine kinase [Paenibacillus sp.]|uniref:sensor histidine kinase n=1 Tax=Paenibacillus sp. TaxID=58172 RepID=UPI002D5C1DAB|nr:sensor histidine kinase [Paenibacillus sp.]HZG87768.1 sensor histidine kinase [Paenibacillus sp.]
MKAWDKIWNYSIKRKISVFTVFMILIPLLVTGAYFIRTIHTILSGSHYEEFVRLADAAHDDLSSQLDLIENTYFMLISDPSFRQDVDRLALTGADVYETNERIDLRMQNFLFFNYPWTSKLLQSVYIFINEETSYFYDYNNVYSNNYQYNNEERNKTMTQLLHVSWPELRDNIARKQRVKQLLPPSPGDPTLYYARDFYDFNSTAFKGLIVLGIDETVLSTFYRTNLRYEGSFAAVVDGQGVIVSHTDHAMLGSSAPPELLGVSSSIAYKEIVIEGRTYLAAARKLGSLGLTTVMAVPKNEVFAKLTASIRQYAIIALLICLLFVFVSSLLSARISKQIGMVVRKMETVHQGNYETRMEDFKEYELRKLSRIFNEMTSQIHYLINEVYEKQLTVKEAELKSLQAQINPHFLFNTLLSIGWKAKKTGSEDVYRMVTSLSELLQASIFAGSRDKTTIADELKNVDFYLYLQQVRFADRFEIDRSRIDPHVYGYYVPKLCLQPIVENAIVHGLERKIGKGRLSIRAEKRNDGIYFEIEDDGVGFDPGVVRWNDARVRRHLPNHTNVGLANTDKRIRYLYGDEYGLTVVSAPGAGAKVVIHIPVDRGEDA